MKRMTVLMIPILLLVGCNSSGNSPELPAKEWLIHFIKSFEGSPNGFHKDNEWATFTTGEYSTGKTWMYQLSVYEPAYTFALSFRTYFGDFPVIGTVSFSWGDFAHGDFQGAMYNSLSDLTCHQVALNNIVLEEYPSFTYEGHSVIRYDVGAPLRNDSELVAAWTYNAIKDAVDMFYKSMSTAEGNKERRDIVLW